MKLVTLLVLFAVTLSVALAKVNSALTLDFIESINLKKPSWVAGRNFPENTTKEYLRKRNGFIGLHSDPNYQPTVVKHKYDLRSIPETFDAREQWPQCPSINRIRDQGACGSCWAFAATETMSDRLCIHSSGSQQFNFSPEDLLSCCTSCGDCVGGYMMNAYDFYLKTGVVSGGDMNSNEGCRPYSAGAHDSGNTPACTKTCRNGYSVSYKQDKHYGSRDYVVNNAIEDIQYEVMTNGPLIVNYEVFEDFYSYQSGVYSYVQGVSEGYHVVKIIGWGTENGLPYWLIANSWGKDWGSMGGFFKILRGRNECGIENYPYAVLPAL